VYVVYVRAEICVCSWKYFCVYVGCGPVCVCNLFL